jgi:hypothetical protein
LEIAAIAVLGFVVEVGNGEHPSSGMVEHFIGDGHIQPLA